MMVREEIQYEEYICEYCENCNHQVSLHYDKPKRVYDSGGEYMYTASGCMVVSGKRKLEGENRYLRCECLKVK